jgi:hypothetical protein
MSFMLCHKLALYADCHYADCGYADSHYTACHGAESEAME